MHENTRKYFHAISNDFAAGLFWYLTVSDLCWFERIHLCYALQNNNYVFSEGALGTLLKNCFQNLLGSFSHSKTTNSSPTLELISNKYTDTNNYVNLTLESQYRSPHSSICYELPQNNKLEGPCSISRTNFQNNSTHRQFHAITFDPYRNGQ